jgi:hypothetical protein
LWAADVAGEFLADQDDAKFRAGLAILRMLARVVTPRTLAIIDSLFRSRVIPRLRPLASAPVPIVEAVGRLFGTIVHNLLALDDVELAMCELFFTEIFDVEIGKAKDQLVRLLAKCAFSQLVGSARLLPLVAPRLSKIWRLPGEVSSKSQDAANRFSQTVGQLEWELDPASLLVALDQAKASLEAGWVVQQQATNFVISAVRRSRNSLDATVQQALVGSAEAMAASGRAEVREGAIRVLAELIPLAESNAKFFEINVKGRAGPVAVASALALVAAVDVVNEIEPWAPTAFEFLETAHAKFKDWSTAIEAGFNAFWKGVGGREVPALDAWRSTFVGGYYS